MLATLRARGLRITPQRLALVEAFAEDPSHPTAQDLFERMRAEPAARAAKSGRRERGAMSFATVYNTLEALAQAGLSTTVRLGAAARFDPNTQPHHHAVCDVCGAIADVPAEAITVEAPDAARVRESAPGFDTLRVELTYRGVCAACADKKNTQKNRRPHHG